MLSFMKSSHKEDESKSDTMSNKKTGKRAKKTEAKPFPGNSNWGLVTGVIDRDLVNPLNSVRSAHALYGDCFCITLFTRKIYFLSSQATVNAMLSDPNTKKINSEFLEELRLGAEDGLFTAHADEPNWAVAHRILIPAFGAMSVRNMYDQMIDISSSMIQRWNAHQGVAMDIPDQLTRLTLDTIALCSFDYRFNSFFKEDMHPFVQDMIDFLSASALRALRPLTKNVNLSAKWKWEGACKRMQDFADEIIRDRVANPKDVNDLCKRMLEMEDPETGKKLSEDNVRAQLLTFLVAGHETTSGLLSFCLYYMVKNPHTIRKAQAEIDAIGYITRDSLTKMPYIDACLKETLRLQPTAPMFSVANDAEIEVPGGYVIPANQMVMIDLHSMQTDPKVWEKPFEFNPDRMLDGKFEKLPPNSWKPFGHGARACIGRAFAIQESILAIASILQNFNLELDDPSYELRTKFTLTIKPDGMKMKVRRRQAGPPIMPLATTERVPSEKLSRPSLNTHISHDSGIEVSEESGKPLSVLFGSNSGSCEALAKEIAESAKSSGMSATVATLDSCLQLPTDRPIILVTASYEGKPCDNAKQFAAYLESKPNLEGVKFAVFGAGHHDWVQSYMHVPRHFESLLIENGAKPLIPRGEGDVAGDFVGEFEAWKEDLMTAIVGASASGTASGTATPLPTNAPVLKIGNIKNLFFEPILSKTLNVDVNNALSTGVVESNEELTPVSKMGVAKRHIVIRLPKNETYETGDYLSILPTNPPKNVARVLSRFGLSEETKINVKAGSGSSLLPVRAFDLLQHSVELATPVQKRLIPTLVQRCSAKSEASYIEALGGSNYQSEVLEKRLSTIDVLEKCRSCTLSFDEYIKSLQSLHQRQYSISSSPLARPDVCTLTIDIIRGAHTGTGDEFEGVTSNYLADLKTGDEISCTVRQSATFHLPEDPEVPIVCFAAGTGIAPFRGFLQERSMQHRAGRNIGETVLYYGCRTNQDFLHKAELEEWAVQTDGKIQIRNTLSRDSTSQFRHIYELVYSQKQEILRLFESGARFYTCGSASKLAHSLRQTWNKMVDEAQTDEERAQCKAFLEATGTNRYAVDIFG